MSHSSSSRARELGMIHVAKKQLALDDDAYRDMLWSVARVRSAADLDAAGREAVIAHLKARGFRPAGKRRPRPPADRAALVAKIRALLIEAGRPDTYADGVARNMFGIEQFQWCDPDQLRRIVAALAYDANRRRAAELAKERTAKVLAPSKGQA